MGRHLQRATTIVIGSRGWAGGVSRRKQNECIFSCLPVADIGLYIACILAVQALVVKYDDSITMDWLEFQHGELSHLLPAEVVSGDDATKENVIERVTSGSASLVHFLVHGTPGGRADLRRCKAKRKKKRVCEILSSFCPPSVVRVAMASLIISTSRTCRDATSLILECILVG